MSLKLFFKYSLSVAAVFLMLSLTGCSGQNDREANPAAGVVDMSKEERKMPAFNLLSPLSEDSYISSDSFKGKVILVSFFASWCRSCLEEIPLLKKLQNKYSDQGFSLVSFAVDSENKVGLKNLIQKHNINYPVLLADEAVKNDFGGVSILPTMFLINREGNLQKKYFGHIERESLVRDIKQNIKL